MKRLTLVFFALITYNLSAQNNKETKKVIEKTLPYFNSIEAGEKFSIQIQNANTNALQIESIEGFEDYIKAEVEGTKLKISSDKRIKQPKNLRLTVFSPEIVSVTLEGAAELVSSDTIKAENFELNLSGAAYAQLYLYVQNLKSKLSGAANLQVAGYANNHVAEITGAGILKAFELVSEKTYLNVSGAGDAYVNASKELNAKVSGTGDVIYTNEPENLLVEITGLGEVRKKSMPTQEPRNDTTRLRIGDIKLIIIDESKTNEKYENAENSDKESRKKKYHKIARWSGLDFGVNAYMTYDHSFKMAPFNRHLELDIHRSYNLALNYFQWEIPIVKNHLSVATGIGNEWRRYAFKNNTLLNPNENKHIGYLDTINYNKSVFRTSWINVPMLLAFNSHKKMEKSFHISTGIILGYCYSQKAKTTYKLSGNDFESISEGDFALNPFKYAATLRLGYGKFNLFATYQLNEMFKKNAGPELYPVTAGITLIGF